MWPTLLRVLPELPAELEYRFSDRDLVLIDGHANVVVDILENALPAPPCDDRESRRGRPLLSAAVPRPGAGISRERTARLGPPSVTQRIWGLTTSRIAVHLVQGAHRDAAHVSGRQPGTEHHPIGDARAGATFSFQP
jgi:hypothetical protein